MSVACQSCILCFLLLFFAPATGFAAGERIAKPALGTGTDVAVAGSVEKIQAKFAALAANRDLPEEERKQAQDLYQQALSQLQAAKTYADSLTNFQQLQQSAASEVVRLQEKLNGESLALPPVNASVEELSRRLAQAQADLSSAQEHVIELEQQLTLQQARPKIIPGELEGLRQQVADLENKLRNNAATASTPLLAEARQTFLNAQRHALNQQIGALEQERLSYDARLSLLNARRAVAVQAVGQARTQIQQLQDLLNSRRRDEAAAVVEQTAQVKEQVAARPTIIQTLADENAATSRRLAELVQQSDTINVEQAQISERLAQLMDRLLGVKQQLSIAGSSDALGPILLEERRNLPEIRHYRQRVEAFQQRIIQTRLEQYRAVESLNQARDVQAALKKITDQLDIQKTGTEREDIVAQARSLLTDRQELLKKITDSYGNLLMGLVALDDVYHKLIEQTDVYRDLLDRHLLWIRSGSALGAEWLKNLGLTIDWLLRPEQWRQVWQNLVRGAQNQPVIAMLSALVWFGLLYYRRALIRRLGEGVEFIGDVRRDRFMLTARALAISILLALPWPWLLATLARLLYISGNRAEFSQGLMQGLFGGAAIVLNITLLRQLCRPRGIAMAHFGWAEAGCGYVRRHLSWFVWVGAASVLIVRLCDMQTEPLYSDTLGRLVFFGGMLAVAGLLWRVLDPTKPLMSAIAETYAKTLLWRLRYFWYWPIVGVYLSLGMLALSGYYYTALQLRGRVMLTAWLLLAILLLVNLFLRWLNLSQRRLALQRALTKREAQLAARATKETGATPTGESVPLELLQVPDLDLSTVSEQTHSIMVLLVWVGLGLGLWYIWEGLIPAFAILNEITLWQHSVSTAPGSQVVDITLGRVLMATTLLVLVGLMAHNLPGMLELMVLRRLTVEPGNRNAIITIIRYLIVGIGLVIALNVIGMNWERLQWLVAALGVGLGFGLQEIFANFVSGLILLLERPIRVGDTVTLGDQSGTVVRIHIRATTLIDWDRKEIIVPNKTFITNALINWTRNDSITRVVVPVSVSYDSDPIQVHSILLEVAASHPLVLKDPAPAVLFLKLGESALEFEVRVFVQELSNRLTLTHELHNRVFETLRAHHIDIPFPQRDVHLRGWPDQPTALSPKVSDG